MIENSVKVTDGRNSIFMVMIFVASLFFCLLSFAFMTSSNVGDEGWAKSASYSFLLWGAVFVLLSRAHYRTTYLYSNAYLLCLALFHYGLVLQMGFGVDVPGWDTGDFSISLAKAVWLVNVAFASFGMGFGLSTLGVRTRYIDVGVARAKIVENKKALYWSGLGMLAASGIFMVMAIAAYGNIFTYERHEIFRSSADSRGWGLFTMVFPGAAALLFFGASNRVQFLVGVTVSTIAVLFFMITGYRSAALFAILAAVITWIKIGRKIPLPIALGILFVAGLSVSISGYLRNTGAYNEIDAQDFKNSYDQASVADVASLGQTVGIVAHSMDRVPEEFPYRWGGSYWRYVKATIPNIGFTIDADTGRYAAKNRLSEDKLAIYKLSPSDWMTYEILPNHYDLGQGVGYSGIAEPYINFGVPGVVFFFAVVGWALGRFDLQRISFNIYHILFAACFFRLLLPTVRNDFSNFTKPTSFCLIILVIWWLCSKYFLNRRLPKRLKR